MQAWQTASRNASGCSGGTTRPFRPSSISTPAAAALKAAGAEDVVAYCTHGVLSGGAVARVEGSALLELVVTDSIGPSDTAKDATKIRHLTIAPLLGEAIKRIADESSVSSLFD